MEISSHTAQCVVCGSTLTGRQTMYCSDKCKSSKHVNAVYKNQQIRAETRKLELITMLGGKCSSCGYSKCPRALCFHHIKDKSFSLDSRHLSNRSWTKTKEEAAKCILLCANCHMELHYKEDNAVKSTALTN